MIYELSSGDKQHIVYSLLLLIFLASSLFFRRDFKFSQALKYLSIWSLIAFIGIILYSYRFEFEDFKNRILVEINPTKARVTKDEKIIINISSDKHFYLNTIINNQPVRFMIDTGASDIVLNMKDAKKIGINPKKLTFNKRYNTANGVVYGAQIKINKLEISDLEFYDLKASVNSGELGVSLLGMSFLREFRRYEFYQDKLILEF